MNIPTRFREVLRDVYGTDMLKITLWKDCLRAYPLPEWEELMRKLNAEGLKHPQGSKFIRTLTTSVVDCPVDRQGRILLPPKTRGDAGIDRDVVVAGVLQHFEIWDRDAWQREFEDMHASFEDYEEIMTAVGVL